MGSIDKACISGFLCRLCSEMHRIVIHIYGDQGKKLCLVEKINGYLPITISPTDPLPKTICQACLRRVEQHYHLLMRLSRIKRNQFNRKKQKTSDSLSKSEESSDEIEALANSPCVTTSTQVSLPHFPRSNSGNIEQNFQMNEC